MIRVVIVDDHAIVRSGLRQFLSDHVDLRVTGEAADGREALELVRGVSGGGLLGVDVVETAPSLEATPATSLMAGRVAIEAMAHHGGAGR